MRAGTAFDKRRDVTPAKQVRVAAWVYGALSAVALLWIAYREGMMGPSGPHFAPVATPASVLWSLGFGLVIGLVVVAMTRVLVRRAAWARRLHVQFGAFLKTSSTRQIALLALSSGVAEELFFRAAMQPTAGLWVTSLLFGFAHWAPDASLRAWTVWAVVMGFVFGLLYEYTGSVAGPMLAHVLINYENMHFIRDHRLEDTPLTEPRTTSDEHAVPSLRGARTRVGGHTRR